MLEGSRAQAPIPGKSDLLLQNPHSEIQHMFYNLLSILVTGVDNAIWCGYHILIRVLVIMPANEEVVLRFIMIMPRITQI